MGESPGVGARIETGLAEVHLGAGASRFRGGHERRMQSR